MSAWVIFTLSAAFIQTARFMLQKRMTMTGISAIGATYARFLWATPFLWAWIVIAGFEIPELSTAFWLQAAVGAIAQIIATASVVELFKSNNFSVGITLKKTEILIAALVGFIFLGDALSVIAIIAMIVGMIGVIQITGKSGQTGFRAIAKNLFNRSAGLGLISGLGFAIAGVAYRGATLSFELPPFERAMIALVFVTTIQLAVMTLWLWMRDRPQLGRIITSWPQTGMISLTSVGGSICWFNAFTLQNAALVYAVGQVEVILSLAVSAFMFGERTTPREIVGIGLVTASVMTLVAVG